VAELARTIADRLSLIRYQLAAAVELSRRPAPIGGMAINVSGPETSLNLTDEIYQRCHRFVLDTAVALGADDYNHNGSAQRRNVPGQ
jgi:hypothetical protein